MKIYNKKGLIWGVFWTIGGLFCLYRDIVDPHDFLPQQIKSVILSVLLLAMGVTGPVLSGLSPNGPPSRIRPRNGTNATSWSA